MIDLTPSRWNSELKQFLHSEDLRERLHTSLHLHYANAASVRTPDERAQHFARVGRVAPEIETEQRIELARRLCTALEITSTIHVADRLLRLLFGRAVSRTYLLTFGLKQRSAAYKPAEQAWPKLNAFQAEIEAQFGVAPPGKPPLHPYADAFLAFSVQLREQADAAREKIKPQYFA